jgi:hypothetical protein
MSNKMFKVDDKRAEQILKDLDDWWPGDGWDKTIRDLLADRALVAPLVEAAVEYAQADAAAEASRHTNKAERVTLAANLVSAEMTLRDQARIIAEAANAGKGASQ